MDIPTLVNKTSQEGLTAEEKVNKTISLRVFATTKEAPNDGFNFLGVSPGPSSLPEH